MKQQVHPPFHLAIPVSDLEATRQFYTKILGCSVGRESATWIDFNFFGHQVTTHLASQDSAVTVTNLVDDIEVPVRHFGVILDWDAWKTLAQELSGKNTRFLIKPHVRFRGKVGEQGTLFLLDPSLNGLEFKAFKKPGDLFARAADTQQ